MAQEIGWTGVFAPKRSLKSTITHNHRKITNISPEHTDHEEDWRLMSRGIGYG